MKKKNKENIQSEEIKNEPTEVNNETENKPVEDVENKQTQEVKVLTIDKPSKDDKSYDEVVEEERKVLLANEKRARKVSTVSMVLILGLGVGAVILLQTAVVVSYILLGCAIAVLVGSFIFNKRIGRPDVQGYISRANMAIDKYVFSGNNFKDSTYTPTEKIALGDVCNDGVYANIMDTASRNVVHSSYKNHPITVAELAMFKNKTSKKDRTYFVGKYMAMANDLHFENRFVLVNANSDETKRMDTPDGLEDLECLLSNEGFCVYGPKGSDYTKVIPASVIKSFRELKLDELLVNNILVVWSGKSVFYSSYDDKIISLPFYDPIDTKAFSRFKSDLEKCADILVTLGDKK